MERKELLKKAKKLRRENYGKPNTGYGSNDNWICLWKNGGDKSYTGPCMGQMNYYVGPIKGIKMLVSNPFRQLHRGTFRRITRAEATYIKWLLNESPWAEVFVDKNLTRVFRTGAIIDTEGYDARFIIQASMNMRIMQEYNTKIPGSFYEIQKYCSPALAFVLAHILSVDKKLVNWSPLSGHCWIMPRVYTRGQGFTVSECLNFLNNTPEPTRYHTFDNSCRFVELRQYWGKDDKVEQTVHALIHPIYRQVAAIGKEYDTLGLPMNVGQVERSNLEVLVRKIEEALSNEQENSKRFHRRAKLWLQQNVPGAGLVRGKAA